jgi:hypothetical protein
MPVSHLILNLGDDFRWHRSGQAERDGICTESCWVGLWSQHYIVDWPPNVRFFGVHFKPGGAYPFSTRILWRLPDIVQVTTCDGGSVSMLRTRNKPGTLATYQLIEFLQYANFAETYN